MKSLFDRWLPALTLALWGGIIMYYEMTGGLRSLLVGEYRIYALIASVFLLTGALVFALYPMDATCCSDSACGHGLSRSRWGRVLTFAIILLPIGLAFFGSVQQLQAVQARNRTAIESSASLPAAMQQKVEQKFANRPAGPAAAGTAATDAATSQPPVLPGSLQPPPPLPLPGKEGSTPPTPAPAASDPKAPTDWLTRTPDGLIVAEVIDLLYAAQDKTLQADFEGKRIQLIGQFLPDRTSTATPRRFKAVRMLMTCCAADARPIATLVEMENLPDFPDMQWVRIVGTPTFPMEKGRRISVLKAEKVEKTEIPADEVGAPQ